MSASALFLLRSQYGSAWEILDWYGGWIAYRRLSWSPEAEAWGILNVVGADSLEELEAKLAAQAAAEDRFRGRPAASQRRRTADCRAIRGSAR